MQGNNIATFRLDKTVTPTSKGTSLTCISCRLLFNTVKDQKEHFQSDLHRFNLKRKVAGLPPVSQEAYDQKINSSTTTEDTAPQHTCLYCNKQYASLNQYTQHLKSKKHLDKVELAKKEGGLPVKPKAIKKEVDAPEVTQPEIVEAEKGEETTTITYEEGEEPLSKEEEEFIQQKLKNAKYLQLTDCLFCSHKADDLESNITHMTKSHGLFIPDLEYLKDVSGLIKYLGEKVSVGNVCLYCNGKGRSFASLEAVQAHMRDMGHCKIQWDENLDEYDDFYDYSRDYPDGNAPDPKSNVRVSEDGTELIFMNGKSVGHRAFNVYYRQRYRPPETRDAVLINTMINQYRLIGWHTNEQSEPTRLDKATQKKQNIMAMKIGIAANNQKHHRKQIFVA